MDEDRTALPKTFPRPPFHGPPSAGPPKIPLSFQFSFFLLPSLGVCSSNLVVFWKAGSLKCTHLEFSGHRVKPGPPFGANHSSGLALGCTSAVCASAARFRLKEDCKKLSILQRFFPARNEMTHQQNCPTKSIQPRETVDLMRHRCVDCQCFTNIPNLWVMCNSRAPLVVVATNLSCWIRTPQPQKTPTRNSCLTSSTNLSTQKSPPNPHNLALRNC